MSHHVHTCYRTCKCIGFKQIGRIPDHPNIVTRLDQTGPFAGPSGAPEPSPMILAGLWLTCPVCGGVPKIGYPRIIQSISLMGCSIINQPFWGFPTLGNPHIGLSGPEAQGSRQNSRLQTSRKPWRSNCQADWGHHQGGYQAAHMLIQAGKSREKQSETIMRGQKINQQRTVICVNEARDTV